MVEQIVVESGHRLGELAERFKQWRETKTQRGEPIPEPLWAEAVALSAVLPRRQICRTLRLSDHDLQRRLGVKVGPPKQREAAHEAAPFVELTDALAAYTPAPGAQAELALERPDGARLELRYAGAVADLAPFVHHFLTAR